MLLNGDTKVTKRHTYKKKWTSEPVDSSYFKHYAEHENYGDLLFGGSKTFEAKEIFSTGYSLFDIFKWKRNKETIVSARDVKDIPNGGFVRGNYIYFPYERHISSRNKKSKIGDVRVYFSEVKCNTVSMIGQLQGTLLTSWKSRQGYDI